MQSDFSFSESQAEEVTNMNRNVVVKRTFVINNIELELKKNVC